MSIVFKTRKQFLKALEERYYKLFEAKMKENNEIKIKELEKEIDEYFKKKVHLVKDLT